MLKVILVADDSATARMIISRCFQIAGNTAQIIEARDGQDALEKARTNEIDLVVTDLNMPNMDGQALLKHIKASPKLAHLPVLVITSANNDAREIELREMGAFAILGKPVTPPEIAKILSNIAKAP